MNFLQRLPTKIEIKEPTEKIRLKAFASRAKVILNQITESTLTTTLSCFCSKNARLGMVGMIFSLRQTLLTVENQPITVAS